jgi:predicted NUDIX family phosphoesterase
MITKEEALKRTAVIDHIDGELINMLRDNYNRKANILQTYYGFEMRKIDPENELRYRSYKDYIFIKDENVFAEIDEAFEYARSNLSKGE